MWWPPGPNQPTGRVPVMSSSIRVQESISSFCSSGLSSTMLTSLVVPCPAISCPASCSARTASGHFSAASEFTSTMAQTFCRSRISRMRQIPTLPPYSAWERELKFTSMRESILKRPVLRKASKATLKVQQTSLPSGQRMVRL